jgi:aminoglycoside phosphotransferase
MPWHEWSETRVIGHDRYLSRLGCLWGTDQDAQWLLTEALPGESAVGDKWRVRRARDTERLRLKATHHEGSHLP